MGINRIQIIIGGSCLACILLILFQVQWMRQSRRLIEENFQQKVDMAVCSAISNLAESGSCSGVSGCALMSNDPVCASNLAALAEDGPLEEELKKTLAHYQIREPFTLEVVTADPLLGAASCNQYSLSPLTGGERHMLKVDFPRKVSYLIKRMGFVIASSIFILLFITMVFAMANLSLHRQQEATRQNTDFFNNMAHEFRTPLTNIGLAARMLSKKHPELQDNPVLKIIHEESRQMNRQLEGILHLSRMEGATPPPLERQPIDLSGLIRQVTGVMEPLIREKNARIDISCEAASSQVRGDAFHLGNAFRNLIDNSLKYCCETPHIRIRIEDAGSSVRVNIQDNGIGIDPEDQSLVFDKFQRVGTGNLHEEKGFGIGLAYVKSIVERHQGSIRLSSARNRGTKFELQLPKG